MNEVGPLVELAPLVEAEEPTSSLVDEVRTPDVEELTNPLVDEVVAPDVLAIDVDPPVEDESALDPDVGRDEVLE